MTGKNHTFERILSKTGIEISANAFSCDWKAAVHAFTFSKIYRREAGFSLLETIVSVAILGSVAVVFMSGLSTLYKSDATARGKALSEGLARSQFESIKSQTYISYVIRHGNYTFIPGPSGYVIEAMITPINFFLKYFLFSLTIHNLFRLFLQEHSQVFPDP